MDKHLTRLCTTIFKRIYENQYLETLTDDQYTNKGNTRISSSQFVITVAHHICDFANKQTNLSSAVELSGTSQTYLPIGLLKYLR